MKHYMNKNNLIGRFTILCILILIIGFFHGCRPRKLLVDEVVPIVDTPEKVFSKLQASQADFDWFAARFSGNAIWEGRNYSVSGLIRLKKDSAIYVSISPVLGIEVARLLLTTDTVKFVNRLEGSYYVGDTQFLKRNLGVDVDFSMLQGLITGNDFKGFETENFVMSNERGMIRLSNPLRSNYNNTLVLSQNMYIDSEHYKIRQNLISDRNERNVAANYAQWENIEGQLFPLSMKLVFSDRANYAELDLRFSRVTINTPQNMNFRIPPRYDQINY